VEQAALLHDIGRIVLNDPAVAAGGYSTRDLAQWSAAIVAEVRHLQPVAEIVADHYRPFRNPGEGRDGGLPVGPHVVKVASAYDVSVGGGMSPRDALEVLHLGSAYDYDPEVVGALRRILQRRGTEGV
jgi:response regulator RpfG family c-di-GMP phosphodiesterase